VKIIIQTSLKLTSSRREFFVGEMNSDPDLSAVVTRSLPNISSNLKKRKLHFGSDPTDLMPNYLLIEEPEKYNKRSISKKYKSSDSKFIISEKENIVPIQKEIQTVKNNIERQAKPNNNFIVDEALLITTFTKAIFLFTLHELIMESKSSPSFGKSVLFFRAFAAKYYDHIIDLDSVRWIWTIDDKEGVWLTTCKKVYKEFSTRFFRDEKIIIKWIDNKVIRQIIKTIYSKYRDIFERSFSNPNALAQLVPILTTLGF